MIFWIRVKFLFEPFPYAAIQYRTWERTNALTSTEMTDDGRHPLRFDKPMRMPKQHRVTDVTCVFQFKVQWNVIRDSWLPKLVRDGDRGILP